MRSWSILVLAFTALSACGSDSTNDDGRQAPAEDVRLSFGRRAVVVPGNSEPLPEVMLLQTYRTSETDDLVGVRTPEGAVIVAQGLHRPLMAEGGETLSVWLDEFLDEQLRLSHIALSDPGVSRSGTDVRRQCARTQRGPDVETTCIFVSVDALAKFMRMDTVRCTGGPSLDGLCARVFDSYDVGSPRLDPNATLVETRPAGLAGVREGTAWWIRFGASSDTFDADCRAAGGRNTVPRAFRAAVEAGRLRECVVQTATDLGPMEKVLVSFDDSGRLVHAAVWLRTGTPEAHRRLTQAYPDWTPLSGVTVYYIDRNAEGMELFAVSAIPSQTDPESLLIHVNTREAHIW